jgi:hypothetical protein
VPVPKAYVEDVEDVGDVDDIGAVRSHSGNVNSRGLMIILYISPSPVFLMIDVNS